MKTPKKPTALPAAKAPAFAAPTSKRFLFWQAQRNTRRRRNNNPTTPPEE